jgi:hypothetical protein
MTTTSTRSPVAAQKAMRAALERAQAAEPKLNVLEWRVLGALIQLVALYDRTEDRVSMRQILDAIGKDRANWESHIKKALKALVTKGVIEREPGYSMAGGRTVASLIRFPLGADSAPTLGADLDTDRGQISPETGGAQMPPSEVPPRSSPMTEEAEGREPARPAADAASSPANLEWLGDLLDRCRYNDADLAHVGLGVQADRLRPGWTFV